MRDEPGEALRRSSYVRRAAGLAAASALALVPTAGATAATPAWTPPQALTPVGIIATLAPVPSLATDAAGGAVAVFSPPATGGVWASGRAAGGAWSPPQQLPGAGSGAGGGTVAVSADGTAAVAWTAGTATGTKVLVSWRAPAGSFGTPQVVATAPAVMGVSIGLDDSHRAIVAYSVPDASSRRHLMAARGTASGFGAPTALSPATQDAALPDLAVDGAGYAVLAWQDVSPGPSAYGGGRAIDAVSFTPASGWGSTAVLETGADLWNVSVALDGAGRATAAWSRGTVTWTTPNAIRVAASSATGVWAAARTVSGRDGSFVSPDVALDDAGDAVIAWQTYLGSSTSSRIDVVRRRGSAGTWSTPSAVSASDTNPLAPSASLGRDGTGAVVSWCGSLGAGATNATSANGSFSRPVSLGRCQWNTAVPVSAGRAGRATAVWPMPVPGRHALVVGAASLE